MCLDVGFARSNFCLTYVSTSPGTPQESGEASGCEGEAEEAENGSAAGQDPVGAALKPHGSLPPPPHLQPSGLSLAPSRSGRLQDSLVSASGAVCGDGGASSKGRSHHERSSIARGRSKTSEGYASAQGAVTGANALNFLLAPQQVSGSGTGTSPAPGKEAAGAGAAGGKDDREVEELQTLLRDLTRNSSFQVGRPAHAQPLH